MDLTLIVFLMQIYRAHHAHYIFKTHGGNQFS